MTIQQISESMILDLRSLEKYVLECLENDLRMRIKAVGFLKYFGVIEQTLEVS